MWTSRRSGGRGPSTAEALERRTLLNAPVAAVVPGSSFHVVGEFISAVSGDGSTAVGSDEIDAIRWTRDGTVRRVAPPPGGAYAGFVDVTDDGSLLLGNVFQRGAYWWTEADGFTAADPIVGISGDGSAGFGSLAVDPQFPYTREPARWTRTGGLQPLGILPTYESGYATGISNDARTVVGTMQYQATFPYRAEAFRWTESGGMQPLGDVNPGLSAPFSVANAVSADGSTVVGMARAIEGEEAYRWTEAEGMVSLGALPARFPEANALAVNADGSVIVGTSTTDTTREPFVWDTRHGMRNLQDVLQAEYGLNLAGLTRIEPLSISHDGTVIGGAARMNDGPIGWVAVLGRPLVNPPRVVARHVFYNDSAFDGSNPLAGPPDDAAIASDKHPLLPGGLASFSNITTYTRGINGIMFDVAGNLPLTALAGIAGSVELKTGAGPDPSKWIDAPRPAQIGIRPGAGALGSDRVTLVWNDGVIRNAWLRVTVTAPAEYGLPADAFFFGNLVGEIGEPALTPAAWTVTAADANSTRTASARRPAPIDSPTDHNRDGVVNVLDYTAARANFGTSVSRPTTVEPIPVTASLQSGTRRAPTRRLVLGLESIRSALPE